LRVPLLQGRGFASTDVADSESVVIIDQVLADKYFPDSPAVGQRLRRGGRATPWATVIGVVGTVKHGSLRDSPGKEALYWPARQRPTSSGALLVRGPGAMATGVADALRGALARVDPELPLFNV